MAKRGSTFRHGWYSLVMEENPMTKNAKSLTVVGLILALIIFLLYKFKKKPVTEVNFGITEVGMTGLCIKNPDGTCAPSVFYGIPENESQLPITHWYDDLPPNQVELIKTLKASGYSDVEIENFRHQVRY